VWARDSVETATINGNKVSLKRGVLTDSTLKLVSSLDNSKSQGLFSLTKSQDRIVLTFDNEQELSRLLVHILATAKVLVKLFSPKTNQTNQTKMSKWSVMNITIIIHSVAHKKELADYMRIAVSEEILVGDLLKRHERIRLDKQADRILQNHAKAVALKSDIAQLQNVQPTPQKVPSLEDKIKITELEGSLEELKTQKKDTSKEIKVTHAKVKEVFSSLL
jgi:hypothetical protein